MEKVIQLQVQDNKLCLDQSILREASLEGTVMVIVRNDTIIIKPISLTEKVRGLVKKKLSYEELDEICVERQL